MPLKTILNIAGGKMGLSPSDAQQRATLLRFVNEAALELYDQCDVQLIEQCFRVNGDQTISLPSYVGQLRAVREFNSQIPWHINQMRPRYNTVNWKDMWRNWRIKGQFALQTTIRNEGPLVITVAEVETPNVVVTVTGSTETAASVTEDITLSALSNQSVNNYDDVTVVTKDRINNHDVIISDVDELLLTTIPNNMLEASYLIIDVSTLPWSTQSTNRQDHYCEVLFKPSLPWLYNDNDEYPAKGYDYIIVNKVMQLWMEEQGKVDLAAAYDDKATRSTARKRENENRATEDQVVFEPNGQDQLLAMIRNRRPGYYHASIYPYLG